MGECLSGQMCPCSVANVPGTETGASLVPVNAASLDTGAPAACLFLLRLWSSGLGGFLTPLPVSRPVPANTLARGSHTSTTDEEGRGREGGGGEEGWEGGEMKGMLS